MKTKINFLKCICIAFLILILAIVILTILPDRSIGFSESAAIKKFMADNSYIRYTGMTKGKYDGYKLTFDLDYPDSSINEAVECYSRFLRYVSDNDMSLNGKVITFSLRATNDSGPGTIEICNYCAQTEDFDFSSIRYVFITESGNDFSVLNHYADTINYLEIHDSSDPMIPDLTSFSQLKEIHLFNCRNTDGSEILSEEIAARLEENRVVVEQR